VALSAQIHWISPPLAIGRGTLSNMHKYLAWPAGYSMLALPRLLRVAVG
jgi:hypothetical protein